MAIRNSKNSHLALSESAGLRSVHDRQYLTEIPLSLFAIVPSCSLIPAPTSPAWPPRTFPYAWMKILLRMDHMLRSWSQKDLSFAVWATSSPWFFVIDACASKICLSSALRFVNSFWSSGTVPTLDLTIFRVTLSAFWSQKGEAIQIHLIERVYLLKL